MRERTHDEEAVLPGVLDMTHNHISNHHASLLPQNQRIQKRDIVLVSDLKHRMHRLVICEGLAKKISQYALCAAAMETCHSWAGDHDSHTLTTK